MEIPGNNRETFRRFVQFTLTPRALLLHEQEQGRPVPVTIREFAAKNDVAPRTLHRWKKSEAFQSVVAEAVEMWGSMPTQTVVQRALDEHFSS